MRKATDSRRQTAGSRQQAVGRRSNTPCPLFSVILSGARNERSRRTPWEGTSVHPCGGHPEAGLVAVTFSGEAEAVPSQGVLRLRSFLAPLRMTDKEHGSRPASRTFCLLPFVFRLLLSGFCFLASFCLLPSAFAQRPTITFESYKLVRTRNVFDPDRRPLVKKEGAPTAAPIQQSDYVALTGTMLNAGKTLAFFSGSRTEFNKVLAVRDSIAKATITKIDGTGVELDRDGRKITVAVGQTVPLDNSAPAAAPASQPVVSAAAAVAAASAAVNSVSSVSSNATRSPAGAAAPPAAPGNPAADARLEEIKKRMMEKRKQDGLQ